MKSVSTLSFLLTFIRLATINAQDSNDVAETNNIENDDTDISKGLPLKSQADGDLNPIEAEEEEIDEKDEDSEDGDETIQGANSEEAEKKSRGRGVHRNGNGHNGHKQGVHKRISKGHLRNHHKPSRGSHRMRGYEGHHKGNYGKHNKGNGWDSDDYSDYSSDDEWYGSHHHPSFALRRHDYGKYQGHKRLDYDSDNYIDSKRKYNNYHGANHINNIYKSDNNHKTYSLHQENHYKPNYKRQSVYRRDVANVENYGPHLDYRRGRRHHRGGFGSGWDSDDNDWSFGHGPRLLNRSHYGNHIIHDNGIYRRDGAEAENYGHHGHHHGGRHFNRGRFGYGWDSHNDWDLGHDRKHNHHNREYNNIDDFYHNYHFNNHDNIGY